jgi:hypothetical protein
VGRSSGIVAHYAIVPAAPPEASDQRGGSIDARVRHRTGTFI